MRLEQLAGLLGAEARGDLSLEITGVAPLESASSGEVTFVADAAHLPAAAKSLSSALILSPELAAEPDLASRALIITRWPKLAFARAITIFHLDRGEARGVSPDLVLGAGSRYGRNCSIHPRVVLGRETVIGDGVTLHPGVVLGDRVSIGDETIIFANVSVYDRTQIGARCRIHSGTVIGADGFSFTPDEEGRQVKLLQVGRVVIEDDVEIGANCCIDRGGFGETRIRRGAKFDNLIQIGHNCEIGEDTVVAALAGFSGGTTVGRRAIIAGQTGTNPHIKIGEGAIITARTGVTKSVAAGKLMGGMMPAMEYQKWRRAQALFARLPELFERLRKLEQASPAGD
jgi:UDP-3-O-[3-hydroxymyristoyl] glucosamine N-acyltransferase